MRIWKAMLFIVLMGLAACKRGTVDTTKDVYEDWEAPAYQIYVLNGEETRIPWKEVPEGRQWIFQVDDDSVLPGKRYKYRVPIVRVEIVSLDEDGHPVPPEQAWGTRSIRHGLNPKHVETGIGGKQH